MSKISDYAALVGTAFSTISDSTDSLVKSLAALTKDVAGLKATIDKLQNSSGTVSPEDQKLLDATQSQANALSEKLKNIAAIAQALDDATEDLPEPPPADGGGETPPADGGTPPTP